VSIQAYLLAVDKQLATISSLLDWLWFYDLFVPLFHGQLVILRVPGSVQSNLEPEHRYQQEEERDENAYLGHVTTHHGCSVTSGTNPFGGREKGCAGCGESLFRLRQDGGSVGGGCLVDFSAGSVGLVFRFSFPNGVVECSRYSVQL